VLDTVKDKCGNVDFLNFVDFEKIFD